MCASGSVAAMANRPANTVAGTRSSPRAARTTTMLAPKAMATPSASALPMRSPPPSAPANIRPMPAMATPIATSVGGASLSRRKMRPSTAETSGAALCRTTALATLVRVIARMNMTNDRASSNPEATPAQPMAR